MQYQTEMRHTQVRHKVWEYSMNRIMLSYHAKRSVLETYWAIMGIAAKRFGHGIGYWLYVCESFTFILHKTLPGKSYKAPSKDSTKLQNVSHTKLIRLRLGKCKGKSILRKTK